MSEQYHIPDSIKDHIPRNFYVVFADELFRAFGRNVFKPDENGIVQVDRLIGTGGFTKALRRTCQRLDMQWLWRYYEPLAWHDSDDFDAELAETTVEQL